MALLINSAGISALKMATCENVPEPLSGVDEGSFAYFTIKDRLPIILTNVIDTLYRDRHIIVSMFGEASSDETKAVIGLLSKLRNEMVTNKPVIPLTSNGVDVTLWNSYLEMQTKHHGVVPKWFESAWLYVECYLYRRIREAFELSTVLREYDPFRQKKEDSFTSAMNAVIELATHLHQTVDERSFSNDEPSMFNTFSTFIEISLWGNKCDLSFSGAMNVQTSNPLCGLDTLKNNILINQTEMVWNTLQQANQLHKGKVRLDLVLDNAGFELFADLCLVHFLEAVGLIDTVHFYVKAIPWYVSDALVEDIYWLLDTLSEQHEGELSRLGQQWNNKLKSGKWIIKKEQFWTLPHTYNEMQAADNKLYRILSESNLIIFKGDLNYRKLTSDRKWEVTTPFLVALRGFLPATLCSLRTLKADVIVGLKEGVKEDLEKHHKDWMISGNFAVIQCALKD